MGLLQLLIQEPLTFFLLAIPLLYSIILHELAHGWVASLMGDPTARYMGRLTMNPLRHLDPIGTVMLFIFGFGWAKPVPVNISLIRNTRSGLIWVSAAGIMANLLLAFLAILIYRLLSQPPGSVERLLYYLAQINIMLASFNLIPIPPLDGSKILMGFLPEKAQHILALMEPYGFFLIIGLLYFGALDPVIHFFRWMILTLIGLLFA